ncbi:polysaccharide pyruvyl transferase family protein [Occultella glacieicola]|uniref:polysaccharide pyruvyl transferase family protein n=1 Tax=Occultella glacieicola TaxID=2518684 RepID=UPI001404CEEE|nr:polysaccharide pyruvyl transferase family protein [Occultella glacieicola]
MTHSHPGRPRRILLRSSWATANIGDVAHSPGALHALRAEGEDVELTLWPCRLGERERRMFAERQPWVRIVDGDLDADGNPTTAALAEAWAEADILVHGSAAGLGAGADLRAWQATGRPYGFFGITYDPFGPYTPSTLAQAATQIAALPADYLSEADRELFAGAEFLYCRDSLTLDYLTRQRLTGPLLEWGPDATFAHDLLDEPAADSLVAEYRLTRGEFLVAVPRSRFAPYHRIHGLTPGRTDHHRDAVNAAHDAEDLAVLAGAITHWVRSTGGQVLVGPEMSYAVDLAADHFPRILPDDVAPQVRVLADYWDLPTATATYARAAGVLTMDCHSPILASTVGTPAIYLRQPTETIKGRMYADLGLGDTVVEVEDHAAAARLAELLDAIAEGRGTRPDVRTAAAHAAATERLAQMASTAVGRHGPGRDTEASDGVGGTKSEVSVGGV